MYPETLENSKTVSIISDDLSFRPSDLLANPEIRKAFPSEETLFSVNLFWKQNLENIEFVRLDKTNKTAHLKLSDSAKIYSLINVPSKMEKEELEKLLSLDNFDFSRIYKKYFVWMLVLDNAFNIGFEDKLNSSSFGEVRIIA